MTVFKSTSPVILVIWALLLLAAITAIGFGRWSLGFISILALSAALAPPILASRWSLTLPLPFLIATTLFVFASIFLGEALDFYERLWWWDLALHGSAAVGFGLTGFLFVFMLFEGDRFASPPSAIAFITFCVAMTMGAMWEILEFGMDQTFGMNMQKSGLNDTMGDLIINAFGGGIASLTGYVYLRQNSAGILGHALTQFINLNKQLYLKYKNRISK